MRMCTRRTFLLTAAGGVVAACGPVVPSGGGRPAATAAPAGKAADALRLVPLKPVELRSPGVPEPTASTAANAVPHDPAVARYDAYGTDAAPGVFPRTIRHAMGTVELRSKPERVIPLDSGELDSVVQLGLQPAAYLEYDASLMPDYLVQVLRGVTTVGSLAEPSLETLARLQPELMLTSKVRHEKIVDQLRAIGPTVYGESTGVVWKQNFALHARALGREVEADATVRAYEERIRRLNAALPLPRPTISVVRVLANNVRYYQRANYSGTILTDLGFPRPASQNVDDFALLNQSLETLGPLGDAQVIVVSPTEGPEGTFVKTMFASPVWLSLEAVKAGRVLVVSDDVWMAGIGYRSAGVVLGDIARYFGA